MNDIFRDKPKRFHLIIAAVEGLHGKFCKFEDFARLQDSGRHLVNKYDQEAIKMSGQILAADKELSRLTNLVNVERENAKYYETQSSERLTRALKAEVQADRWKGWLQLALTLLVLSTTLNVLNLLAGVHL
jgi:hypothetical protein